ncbi:MAG TPA: hypothetical protein PKA00_00100 [Saprospiraceae bacterium]|nr:hypothetical protein [Saprospiraceae bacterium]HMQ81264.1 hypothetical protein [Saprospiraceae bacterium]
MNRFSILLLAIVPLFYTSCFYDNEEDLYPDTGNCETTDISYSQDVLTLLQNNCYVCHAAAINLGNINLEGYDRVKVYVDNGALLGAIKHESGYSPMPQGTAQLQVCEIALIEAWIADGALDN